MSHAGCRVNAKHIAKLLREIAALHFELAEAFEEQKAKPKRKRPLAEPTMQPSTEVVDRMRRKLRSKGFAT
jgi:hypothetical protein